MIGEMTQSLWPDPTNLLDVIGFHQNKCTHIFYSISSFHFNLLSHNIHKSLRKTYVIWKCNLNYIFCCILICSTISSWPVQIVIVWVCVSDSTGPWCAHNDWCWTNLLSAGHISYYSRDDEQVQHRKGSKTCDFFLFIFTHKLSWDYILTFWG